MTEGEDIIFENGSPTNPDAWDTFKRMTDRMLIGEHMEISERIIEKVFNRGKHPITGMTLLSRAEAFKNFCALNHFDYTQPVDRPSFIIRKTI